MNHQAPSPAGGLFDAIARSWRLPSAAARACVSADGRTVALARADGALSLLPLEDPEPAESRLHISADDGRATIRMRRHAPAPLIGTAPLSAAPLSLAARGDGGFLAGCRDGSLLAVAADGSATPLATTLAGAVAALARAPSGRMTACAAGTDLFFLPDEGKMTQGVAGMPSEITALAFSPDGRHLAVGVEGRVAMLSLAEDSVRMILLPGTPRAVKWHPGGSWLACGLGAAGMALIDLNRGTSTIFSEFPTPVLSLDWSAPAGAILAAGAFRIAAWSMADPPFRSSREGALVTGRPGLVPVLAVAAHPTKPLAAAGYVNGQIVVAPLGQAEELPVKPVGGSITTLDWAPGGQLIACSADGDAAIMTFPQRLFK